MWRLQAIAAKSLGLSFFSCVLGGLTFESRSRAAPRALRGAFLGLGCASAHGEKWCSPVIFAPFAVSLWGVLLYIKAIFASIFMRGCLLQGKTSENLALAFCMR